MRILWTLLKIIIGLAIAIPLGVLVLGATLGIVGLLIGLAVLALKLACIALVGYGAFRIFRHLFWPATTPAKPSSTALPAADAHADPYYAAAMRELDAELGPSPRS